MSLLAKTFVIVNLVLSVCFFATSATLFKTRNDWKKAYLSYKELTSEKVEQLDGKIGQMTGRIDELEKANVTYKGDNDRLSAEAKTLREQITAKDTEIAQVVEDRKEQTILSQNLAKSLEEQETTNQQLQTALETAKSDLDTALSNLKTANETRDTALLDLSKANEDLHNTRVELASLSEEAETLRQQGAGLRLHAGIGGQPERRVRGVQDAGDGVEHAELRDALELAHPRPLQGLRSDHRRRRVELLQVLDDGEGLEQVAAVVELEHGQAAEGVAGEVVGTPLLPLPQVHHHLLQRDAGARLGLLRQVQADPGRVGSHGEDVELHGSLRR